MGDSMSCLKFGYGLLHKKSSTLLGVEISYPAYCHTLEYNSETIWIVERRIIASYVRSNTTEGYNATHNCPVNPFKPEQLEVVRIDISAQAVEPDPLPTLQEYLELKFNTPGRGPV